MVEYIDLWKPKTERNGNPFDFLLDMEVVDFRKLNITDEEAKEILITMRNYLHEFAIKRGDGLYEVDG